MTANRWIVMWCTAIVLAARQTNQPSDQRLPTRSPSAPAAPARPSEDRNAELIAVMGSDDAMSRYVAVADAAKLSRIDVSEGLLKALMVLLKDLEEKAGTREWAARASGKLAPHGAIVLFPKLEDAGIGISYDAWIEVGAAASPYLRTAANNPDETTMAFAALSGVVKDHPDDPETIKTIPWLLGALEIARH